MKNNELKPCPFCGSGAEMLEGRYSADGMRDKPWVVRCKNCRATILRYPEYGEGNYLWLHTTKGEAYMREVIVELWNKRDEKKWVQS